MKASLSRRTFLRSSAILAAMPAGLAKLAAAQPATLRAYVGTYTGGGQNHGEGIYLFDMNPATGSLSNRKLVATTPSPSWVTIHPSKKFLYAANEIGNYNGAHSGSVSAFAIQADGSLQPLNTVSSEGAGPCYVSITPNGKYAFASNYEGGSVAAFPIHDDGSLGSASDTQVRTGSVGSKHATNAPRGSFAISGHEAPHAHIILPDPQGKFILATDLGQDRIYVYRLDYATGKLLPAETPFATLPTGDGPRHIAFHPNGRWLYSIQEESSTIALFDYNAETGALTARQTISALPDGFAGTSYTSEILVHPNGKHLYAANRLNDSIGVLKIAADGTLTHIGQTSTLGDYPVQLRIDPSSRWLYSCNLHSDAITVFRIAKETGLLTSTGEFVAAGSASSITFL